MTISISTQLIDAFNDEWNGNVDVGLKFLITLLKTKDVSPDEWIQFHPKDSNRKFHLSILDIAFINHWDAKYVKQLLLDNEINFRSDTLSRAFRYYLTNLNKDTEADHEIMLFFLNQKIYTTNVCLGHFYSDLNDNHYDDYSNLDFSHFSIIRSP